ncbi:hypothetical protein [Microbacterium arborescens]|uniref:hypothetical protein n=1 Tax=Microbacterium arborescens TaxID=33883 RepID=UPI000B2EC8FE|nr:hypothetical protein [Microbacterium arborescens]
MTARARARLRAVGLGASLGLFFGLAVTLLSDPTYDGRVLLAALALAAAAALKDSA